MKRIKLLAWVVVILLLASSVPSSRGAGNIRTTVREDPQVYVFSGSSGCSLNFERDTREWVVWDLSGNTRFRGSDEEAAIYYLQVECFLLPD